MVRVFHFMQKQHAISNLKNSRLKVATLDSMNDPYEFYLHFEDASDEDLENFKNHFTVKIGFLCFSQNLNDPVQWAHYADNHRGVCFEFEIPDSILQEITYLDAPLHITPKEENWRGNLVSATLSKYKGWAYEQEYRISIDLESEEVKKESGLHFVRIEKALVPTKIYKGVRCELLEEERKIFQAHGVEVIEMVQDTKTYSIVQA